MVLYPFFGNGFKPLTVVSGKNLHLRLILGAGFHGQGQGVRFQVQGQGFRYKVKVSGVRFQVSGK